MARERTPKDLGAGSITFAVGDMLDPALGTFDHVVAMDSLIHYVGEDIAQTLASLAQRTRGSMVFTVAPRTPALTLLWFVGRMFPRSDRAPAIEPIAQSALERHMGELPQLNGWTIHRSQRVSRSFYISQALEVKRS
jgi:magnesium-protoporphyrin O-methyltransferase